MQLRGVPEGVELVEISTEPIRNAFWLECGIICRGVDGYLVPPGNLIVKPAAGYGFKYDSFRNSWHSVQQFVAARTIKAVFRITDCFDEQLIEHHVKNLPGFRGIRDETA